MRSGTVLLAFGAGGGPDPPILGLGFETALNHRNTVQFPKNSKIYERAERQVPETASFGKR
jgi:hypothetical protein